jgi:hypothetical protein
LNISKSNSLFIDSNILEKVSKITPSGLIDVGKYSILILGIVLEFAIGLDLSIDFVSENVLISQEVSNLVLRDWHSLLISVLHCVFLMLVSVLQGKVLFLADLGKLSSELVRASGIDQLVGGLLEFVKVSVLVSNQMQEDLGLFLIQLREVRHELLKVLLVIQMPLVLSFGGQVQHFNVVFEFIRVGVHVFEDLFMDELFVIKLSNLFFWIEFNSCIGVPLFAVHLSEKIPLLLSFLWLRKLLSLNQVEW